MAKPVFAVVLSGCGVMDGSEIHEAVLALLAIDRQGGVAQCFAPDIDQLEVVDHRTQRAVAGERRNVLAESARIARGRIKPLSAFDPAKADGLIFPGGYGAAKNLCSFAFDGSDCTIDPDVERAIRGMAAAGKPIGALCIAPVLLARLLASVEVTIGNDAGTASAIEQMGARHRVAGHGEVVIDRVRKVVSCPCYMLEATVSQIADDAYAAVGAMLELMG